MTLAIIKPDAFGAGKAGAVLSALEDAGFKVRGARVSKLGREAAQAFYAVHRERPFFSSLVDFMTSGPCMPLALEHRRAVPYLREVIGATDPAEAEAGTIRARYAESKERNAIHASDSDENARRELGFFFGEVDLIEAG
ncbi:MAG: nucleoside-diphosphate kinase [Gemmatimonadota bacterium]|nr:nucleoside-diphosphate kinase [Gemmatimonadota bacterium]